MPLFAPPVFANAGGITKAPLVSSQPMTANPGLDIYDAQSELAKRKRALLSLNDPNNPYRSASNAAGRAALDLYNPANPYRAASTGAKRALINAEGVQSGNQRSYYNTLGGIINQRTGETQALINAGHDVADLTAVAQAKGHDNAVNRLRDAVGIARPIEITTPQGDTSALPVGVARSRLTNAEYIDQANKEAEAGRTNTLAALRNNLDLGQLDVGDVRRQGQAADLNLTEAEQGASYLDKLTGQDLQDALDAAGFQRDSSALDVAGLQRAPYGQELYVDPVTGASRYVTPAEKDALDNQYQQTVGLQRIPSQYATSQAKQQYSTQQESGGSPLAGYNTADFVDMLVPGLSGDIDSSQASLAVLRNQVYAELVRRYLQKGYPQATAQQQAESDLTQLLGAAQTARQKAAGATSGPTIARPSFGP